MILDTEVLQIIAAGKPEKIHFISLTTPHGFPLEWFLLITMGTYSWVGSHVVPTFFCIKVFNLWL